MLASPVQAMGMMLPAPGRGDVASQMAGADPTLEGKMACMSIGSYADCARNTMRLDKTLDELKVRCRFSPSTHPVSRARQGRSAPKRLCAVSWSPTWWRHPGPVVYNPDFMWDTYVGRTALRRTTCGRSRPASWS
jgi:hypothetical protein